MGYVYDQLAEGRFEFHGLVGDPTVTRVVGRLLSGAKVLHVEEALGYYREETPEEQRVYIEDFPNLSPPFEKFFVEAGGAVPVAFSGLSFRPDLDQFLWESGFWECGCLFWAVDPGDPDVSPVVREQASVVLERACGEEALEEGAWLALHAYLFGASPTDGVIRGPLDQWVLGVREDGSVLREPTGSHAGIAAIPVRGPEESPAEKLLYERTTVGGYLLPFLFSVCVANSPHTELSAAGRSGTEQYELRMEELKRILEEKGKAKDLGLVRALRACRHHFFRANSDR